MPRPPNKGQGIFALQGKTMNDKKLDILEPKNRTCRFCGNEYKGLRVFCDDPDCKLEWEYQVKSNAGKYGPFPNSKSSTPVGGVFYVDIPTDLEKEIETDPSTKTKENYITKIQELSLKLKESYNK